METRQLSDMQFKKIIPTNNPLQKHFPRRQNVVERRDGRTYVLNKKKVDIYLANDDYEPPKDKNNNPQPKHDYQSKDKLSSLPTADIISFSVSKNRNLIVIVDKNSFVYKLELKRRKPLHKIIKSYRSFFQKKKKKIDLRFFSAKFLIKPWKFSLDRNIQKFVTEIFDVESDIKYFQQDF